MQLTKDRSFAPTVFIIVFSVLIICTQQLPELQNHEQIKQHFHLTKRSFNHQYWFNKDHPTNYFWVSDRNWNYCDYKCLYLENYIKNKDFVVVVLTQFMKQTFSACYVKSGNQLTLWKQVISNNFYEAQCGQDNKDWITDGFTIKGTYGVGIGTRLNQTQIYK